MLTFFGNFPPFFLFFVLAIFLIYINYGIVLFFFSILGLCLRMESDRFSSCIRVGAYILRNSSLVIITLDVYLVVQETKTMTGVSLACNCAKNKL